MPQWGNTDVASNSVFWAPDLLNVRANTANRTALYGNTTVGAFVGNIVVGQVGINTSEKANTSSDLSYAAHAGWNLRKVGTGALVSITISAGGTGYSNTDLIKVTPSSPGAVNATATLTTNATGGITSVTITNAGSGFISVNPANVAITNATGGTTSGSTANLVATAGGRAGRISYETLVASGTIS